MAGFERRFIFFSSEDKGYEIAIGKIPRGHIEIERKGERLSFKVFIENLKEMIYQIQLFTFGGNYVILDEVSIGKSGKQEGRYSTNSLNVLNSGIRWQEFDVVVIRPQGSEHSRKVPLVAWLNNSKYGKGEIPFIKNRAIEDIQKPGPVYEEQVEEEIKKGLDERPVEVEPFLEKPAEEEANKWEEDIGEAEDGLLEEFIEEPMEEFMKEVIKEPMEESFKEEVFIEEELYGDDEKELNEEEIGRKEIGIEDEENSNQEGYWVDYDREVPYFYLNQNIQELEKFLTEITPFYPPMKNHKWWQIVEGQEGLDGFYLYFNGSFVDIGYPYMDYKNIGKAYTEEYNHRIFGIVFNNDTEKQIGYFVYGIPGRLCLQEQPFQGNTGFLYWHPSEGSENAPGEMGYWLLYVEAHSGIIAIPKRPTIAPSCQE